MQCQRLVRAQWNGKENILGEEGSGKSEDTLKLESKKYAVDS